MKKIESGQGLVEYALLLMLISLVVIVVLALLGPGIGNAFNETIDSLQITQPAQATPIPTDMPTETPAPSPTPNWTLCADEGDICSFTGTKEVRYGANGQYFYGTFTGHAHCNNSVFGDPLYGTFKYCHYR